MCPHTIWDTWYCCQSGDQRCCSLQNGDREARRQAQNCGCRSCYAENKRAIFIRTKRRAKEYSTTTAAANERTSRWALETQIDWRSKSWSNSISILSKWWTIQSTERYFPGTGPHIRIQNQFFSNLILYAFATMLWCLLSHCIIPYPQSPTHCIVVYVYISRISMVGSVGFVLSEISGDNWTNLTKPSEYAYSSVL